eukprot:CAMPEP_0201709990 /NCGR_PEP_ID=MMETSP0578-20130828/58393_1 /ASSEMBLY_ACC=CAM_ASM_000663 /TAXON_ID=267565 /ORGANISM="Skeletonema grethea, Strain CCMP 1804" /LENGTH=398 /DNA_ID=CAMNT_0048198993 /DNA_START=22 /DNA_END=1215 /DNA_ORIENTATION=+
MSAPGFFLIAVATGWLFTRKAKITESPNQSSPSRHSNIRMVTVSAISFFLGLQFSHLKELLHTDSNGGGLIHRGATEYMSWAPDDVEQAERRNRGMRRRRKQTQSIAVKKKKVKALPRYHDSNYTKDNFEPLPWSLPKPSPTRYQTSEEFMADYIALKRKHNIPLPWEQEKYREDKVTLPRPIIGLNFPKSATLTMTDYFSCGGITSIHTTTQDGRIGICMMENHLADKPPMEGCNTHKNKKEKTEPKPIEVIFDIGLQGPPCYYASVHDGGLENIAKHYPEGTIMLVTRNATKWFKSFEGWGEILKQWKKSCGFDGSLDGEGMEYWSNSYRSSRNKKQYWIDFYEAHTQKIREFALQHLSLTYVEVELENEKMAEQLEQYTGVKQACVQVCHPGPFW